MLGSPPHLSSPRSPPPRSSPPTRTTLHAPTTPPHSTSPYSSSLSPSRQIAQQQVVLARQRLAHAEAALTAAAEFEEDGERLGASRHVHLVNVAARIRAVLLARHASRLQTALRDWRIVTAALSREESAYLDGGGADQLLKAWDMARSMAGLGATAEGGAWGGGAQVTVGLTPTAGLHPTAGEGVEGMLELVLAHRRPAALQWALSMWVRAVAAKSRVASQAALLEGKWAMMQASALDSAHKEQMVRGVLRWWRQGDLARGWAHWHAVATLLPPPSRHVHVRLA